LTASALRSKAVSILLAGMILVSTFPAWGQSREVYVSGNRQLQEAKILYDNLQYREAMKKLKKAIRAKGNKRRDIVEIYKYMGFIYIVQGQKKHAGRAFELLLKVNPDYEMNPLLTSPKILNFFNKVKEKVAKKDKVIMRHKPLTELAAAERVELKAYVVDLHRKLQDMKVYYRRRGDPEYSSVDMQPSKEATAGRGAITYVGYIPFIWNVYDEVELFIDYYIAGLDREGRWVANMGNPKQPMAFRINLMSGRVPEGARRTPLLKSWWFWTLIVAGVAGASTGTYFLIDSLSSGRGTPSTGEAVLFLE
jgi:tetratricopeptide (TPR) repeat protein